MADVLLARRKSYHPNYSYKLEAGGRMGMDTPFLMGEDDVDERAMAAWITFASGERRDGVGDLLNVEGIDTSRHIKNPIVLFDHAKQVCEPVALAEDPATRAYMVAIDPMNRVARAKAFFYQGRDPLAQLEGQKQYDHALFCEQLFDLIVKRYVRAGSIGYQVIKAVPLPPDYFTGTPQGLHLQKTLLLEVSAVVMPANADTVRKCLDLPKVAGKPLSPVLVKSLAPYASPRKAQLGYEGRKAANKVGLDAAKQNYEDMAGNDPARSEGHEQMARRMAATVGGVAALRDHPITLTDTAEEIQRTGARGRQAQRDTERLIARGGVIGPEPAYPRYETDYADSQESKAANKQGMDEANQAYRESRDYGATHAAAADVAATYAHLGAQRNHRRSPGDVADRADFDTRRMARQPGVLAPEDDTPYEADYADSEEKSVPQHVGHEGERAVPLANLPPTDYQPAAWRPGVGALKAIPGDLLAGGRADNVPRSAFDPAAVARGAREEREHSSDRRIQEEIARDHLAGDPHAYDKKYVERRGDSWVVLSKKGKVLGTHPSKQKADAQLRAIEANKHKDLPNQGEKVRPIGSEQMRFNLNRVGGVGNSEYLIDEEGGWGDAAWDSPQKVTVHGHNETYGEPTNQVTYSDGSQDQLGWADSDLRRPFGDAVRQVGSAYHQNPEDEAQRQVFADALEEEGHGDLAEMSRANRRVAQTVAQGAHNYDVDQRRRTERGKSLRQLRAKYKGHDDEPTNRDRRPQVSDPVNADTSTYPSFSAASSDDLGSEMGEPFREEDLAELGRHDEVMNPKDVQRLSLYALRQNRRAQRGESLDAPSTPEEQARFYRNYSRDVNVAPNSEKAVKASVGPRDNFDYLGWMQDNGLADPFDDNQAIELTEADVRPDHRVVELSDDVIIDGKSVDWSRENVGPHEGRPLTGSHNVVDFQAAPEYARASSRYLEESHNNQQRADTHDFAPEEFARMLQAGEEQRGQKAQEPNSAGHEELDRLESGGLSDWVRSAGRAVGGAARSAWDYVDQSDPFGALDRATEGVTDFASNPLSSVDRYLERYRDPADQRQYLRGSWAPQEGDAFSEAQRPAKPAQKPKPKPKPNWTAPQPEDWPQDDGKSLGAKGHGEEMGGFVHRPHTDKRVQDTTQRIYENETFGDHPGLDLGAEVRRRDEEVDELYPDPEQNLNVFGHSTSDADRMIYERQAGTGPYSTGAQAAREARIHSDEASMREAMTPWDQRKKYIKSVRDRYAGRRGRKSDVDDRPGGNEPLPPSVDTDAEPRGSYGHVVYTPDEQSPGRFVATSQIAGREAPVRVRAIPPGAVMANVGLSRERRANDTAAGQTPPTSLDLTAAADELNRILADDPTYKG